MLNLIYPHSQGSGREQTNNLGDSRMVNIDPERRAEAQAKDRRQLDSHVDKSPKNRPDGWSINAQTRRQKDYASDDAQVVNHGG